MSYEVLMGTGFYRGFLDQSAKNPRSLWLDNASCHGAGVPDLSHWIHSYASTQQYSSVQLLFSRGTSAHLKPYIQVLFERGAGNRDAAAVTIALTVWQIPIPHGGGGAHEQGHRRVIIGSGSLNQDVGKGQVHAELITTQLLLDKLGDVPAHYGWAGPATLQEIDILIYTGKLAKGNVQDFVPCGSCERTLVAALKPFAAQTTNVSNLGKALKV